MKVYLCSGEHDHPNMMPDVRGSTFCEQLAAAVIVRAVDDLCMVPSKESDEKAKVLLYEDVATALDFLFGPDAGCSGWLGIRGIPVGEFRAGLIRALTKTANQTLVGVRNKSRQAVRYGAEVALGRIREYVETGKTPWLETE